MKKLAMYTGNVPVVEKGEKGATERFREWDDIPENESLQSGADGDTYIDYVIYQEDWYVCILTHNKNSQQYKPTNGTFWEKVSEQSRIATKLLLATKGFIKNLQVDEVIITDQGEGKGNTLLKATKEGIECNQGVFKNGIFQNVKVTGSLRNPFSYANDSIDTNYSDNVAMISYNGGWQTSYSIPWDVSQSGRKLSIVNYRWGNEIAQGQAAISAPNGKYFFEDGLQKSELKISREIIELIGYGTSTEFYGWIVVSRIDLMPAQRYGHCLKALAFGTCTGSDTTAKTSLTYTTFDGSALGVTRQERGVYRITYPSDWFSGIIANCRVIPTGRGNCLGETTPAKANLHSIGKYYFEVSVSDDNSRNDGSFDFIVYNGSDFDILHS